MGRGGEGGVGGRKTFLGHNRTLVEGQRWSNPCNKAEETSCVRGEEFQPNNVQLVRQCVGHDFTCPQIQSTSRKQTPRI